MVIDMLREWLYFFISDVNNFASEKLGGVSILAPL
jgi:hypothetical protein